MNLPTWITLSRLLGLPFILYLLNYPTTEHRWLCVGIFVVAAGTDWPCVRCHGLRNGPQSRRFQQPASERQGTCFFLSVGGRHAADIQFSTQGRRVARMAASYNHVNNDFNSCVCINY